LPNCNSVVDEAKHLIGIICSKNWS